MKYIIEFSKTGTICYTSHLDIMRVFQRAFRKADFKLEYSQGFNPHPKMGFAQPLSLGYWGLKEYIEFDTREEMACDDIMARLKPIMPEGLDLKRCIEAPWLKKTLAAHTVSSEYMISIPLNEPINLDSSALYEKYMGQNEINAWKKQKKKKELKQIDIKPLIRSISFLPSKEIDDDNVSSDVLIIDANLDQGSESNLSPELVVTTVKEALGIGTERSEIAVMRKSIGFVDGIKL